jgi:hypothetical protein
MKNKCDCYHIQTEKRHTYHITGEPIYYDAEVSVCWGTKERDRCSCGGDRIKCDFYPEVREKAKKEKNKDITKIGEDSFIITYDCCPPDAPTLCVARREGDKMRVLNTIQGDEALYGYAWLIGFATLKEQTRRKKK